MITQYDFFRTKYGEELLVDLICLKDLARYIASTPVQRLTYYDITVITDGQGTFNIDNHTLEINPGKIFFSSPGQIRKWNTSSIPNGYALIFEDEFLCAFFHDTQFVHNLCYFNSPEFPPVLQLQPEECNNVMALLQNIKFEISLFKYNDKHILRALLYQVLVLLNRKYVSSYPSSAKKLVTRYLDDFIRLVNLEHHQHRTVNHYAQQLYISSGHLNSIVKEHFGISAKKYIINRNILEAKRMLRYTKMSIDEIASHLNYQNTTYFIRTFKEHTHATPLNFRRQMNP